VKGVTTKLCSRLPTERSTNGGLPMAGSPCPLPIGIPTPSRYPPIANFIPASTSTAMSVASTRSRPMTQSAPSTRDVPFRIAPRLAPSSSNPTLTQYPTPSRNMPALMSALTTSAHCNHAQGDGHPRGPPIANPMLVRPTNAQTYVKSNVTAVQSTNATQKAAGLSSKANILTA